MGKKDSSFSEEKEAKRLLRMARRRGCDSGAKVFWFFFLKKNTLRTTT
jgi:hypothetical protein